MQTVTPLKRRKAAALIKAFVQLITGLFGIGKKTANSWAGVALVSVAWKIGVMTNMALVSAKSRSSHDSAHPFNNYTYTRESPII